MTYHVAIVLFMLGQTRFLLRWGEARGQVIDAVYTNQRCDHDRYYDDDYYHNQSYGNITHSLFQVSSTRTCKRRKRDNSKFVTSYSVSAIEKKLIEGLGLKYEWSKKKKV